MTDQELRDQIEQEILTLSLGYTFEISDYATSRHQEAVYKKKGLEQVRRVANRFTMFIREQQLAILDQVRMSLHKRPRSADMSPDENDTAFADGWKQAIHDTQGKINTIKSGIEKGKE